MSLLRRLFGWTCGRCGKQGWLGPAGRLWSEDKSRTDLCPACWDREREGCGGVAPARED